MNTVRLGPALRHCVNVGDCETVQDLKDSAWLVEVVVYYIVCG